MAYIPTILAFAGSTREESYNKRLVRIAAGAAQEAGANVTLVDLRDFSMPLFDQDLEAREGIPGPARRLKDLMIAHDGLLIAAPEYNSSISGVLKNAIDWASRAGPGEPPLAAYSGKVASIMSASPGALGGLRGLVHVRAVLGNLGVIVLPGQVALPQAAEAFNTDGSLKDLKRSAAVRRLGEDLTRVLTKLFA